MQKNEQNIILKFFKEKKFNEAEVYLNKLIKNNKDNTQYKNLLSIVLINKSKNDQAEKILKQILNDNPNYIDAIINLANLYSDLGFYNKAEIYFKKALVIQPDNVVLLDGYASTLIHLNKQNVAVTVLKKILNKDPKNINSLINLGICSLEKNNFNLARNFFEKAKKINKNFYNIYYNLGLLEDKTKHSALAIDNFLYAIKLNPVHAQSYYNLGCIYQEKGNIEKAYINFKKACKIKTNYNDAKINLSRIDLSKQKFSSGWSGYELRHGGVEKTYKNLNIDLKNIWNGTTIEEKLIVHGEQGLGDQILFSSIFRELKKYSNNITVTLDKRLLAIMKRGFERINFLDRMEPIKIDEKNTKNIMLGSLGKFFRRKESDFKSNKNPWLHVLNSKNKEINNIFSFSNKIKVGLSWKGSSLKRVNRQIDLGELIKIFDPNKYELINLQHSDFLKDINFVSKKFNRKIIFEKEFDYKNDIEGILALINKCDMVVTLGNTVAHLSSSLGKKTFVLVAPNAQWYWLSENKKKLWYPNCNVVVSENDDWSKSISFLKNKLLIT